MFTVSDVLQKHLYQVIWLPNRKNVNNVSKCLHLQVVWISTRQWKVPDSSASVTRSTSRSSRSRTCRDFCQVCVVAMMSVDVSRLIQLVMTKNLNPIGTIQTRTRKLIKTAPTVSPKIGSRPSDHYFRSVCWFVCLFVCAEFFSDVFDPILIKLGHMIYVWV